MQKGAARMRACLNSSHPRSAPEHRKKGHRVRGRERLFSENTREHTKKRHRGQTRRKTKLKDHIDNKHVPYSWEERGRGENTTTKPSPFPTENTHTAHHANRKRLPHRTTARLHRRAPWPLPLKFGLWQRYSNAVGRPAAMRLARAL